MAVELFGLSFQPLSILLGLVAGLVYGTTYYVKEHLTKGESYDPGKFAEALTLGFVLGAVAGFLGLSIPDAQAVLAQSSSYTVIVLVLHQLVIPIVTKVLERAAAILKPKIG